MKKIIRHSAFITTIFLIISCAASRKNSEQNISIIPLSDTSVIREGSIVYALPRTVFTMVVTMERTIEIPGPYARYAGELLGLSDAIQSESESWAIQDITVRTNEEPDPSEYYIIASNTAFQTNTLALKKEGLILDLNPAYFYSTDNQAGSNASEINQVHSFDLGSDEYYQQQSDTAYKRVTVDSTFIRIPYLLEKKKRLTIDQLAEKAAKRLMEMRDGKHLILTGEATVFPQSADAINEMNRLEKEYTELFSGKIWKETKKFYYQIIPVKEMAGKPVTLFRFSELSGTVAVTSKDGIPVTVAFKPEQKTKNLTLISKNQGEQNGPKYDKLYYRVPDVVNMNISVGAEVLFNSRKLVYQFGELVQLPSNYIIGR
jgi:hypothetical protein